jgi:spore coat protein CotF
MARSVVMMEMTTSSSTSVNALTLAASLEMSPHLRPIFSSSDSKTLEPAEHTNSTNYYMTMPAK